MICACKFLGTVTQPDWQDLAALFEESGFEIYITHGTVEVEEDDQAESRVEIQLATNEVIERFQTRFFEVLEYADSLEPYARDLVLSTWSDGVAEFSEGFIGGSLEEWVANYLPEME